MKLNGWQRAGIVAAALWAIVGSIGFWRDGHSPAMQVYMMDYKRCIDMPEVQRNACDQLAVARFHKELDGATGEFWQFVPFVITIPPLIVWGLISLIIVIVRWIRNGFGAAA